jgi:hypothetical protein
MTIVMCCKWEAARHLLLDTAQDLREALPTGVGTFPMRKTDGTIISRRAVNSFKLSSWGYVTLSSKGFSLSLCGIRESVFMGFKLVDKTPTGLMVLCFILAVEERNTDTV